MHGPLWVYVGGFLEMLVLRALVVGPMDLATASMAFRVLDVNPPCWGEAVFRKRKNRKKKERSPERIVYNG